MDDFDSILDTANSAIENGVPLVIGFDTMDIVYISLGILAAIAIGYFIGGTLLKATA